jgi:hypothetical protein
MVSLQHQLPNEPHPPLATIGMGNGAANATFAMVRLMTTNVIAHRVVERNTVLMS